jgi:hypothetical protein
MNTRPPRAHRLAALYLAGPDNIDSRRADLEKLAKAKGWPRTELYHDTDGYKPELRRLRSTRAGGIGPRACSSAWGAVSAMHVRCRRRRRHGRSRSERRPQSSSYNDTSPATYSVNELST